MQNLSKKIKNTSEFHDKSNHFVSQFIDDKNNLLICATWKSKLQKIKKSINKLG